MHVNLLKPWIMPGAVVMTASVAESDDVEDCELIAVQTDEGGLPPLDDILTDDQ